MSSALRTETDLCSQQVDESFVVFAQAPVKTRLSWQEIKGQNATRQLSHYVYTNIPEILC